MNNSTTRAVAKAIAAELIKATGVQAKGWAVRFGADDTTLQRARDRLETAMSYSKGANMVFSNLRDGEQDARAYARALQNEANHPSNYVATQAKPILKNAATIANEIAALYRETYNLVEGLREHPEQAAPVLNRALQNMKQMDSAFDELVSKLKRVEAMSR
jgi:hypothetical protein